MSLFRYSTLLLLLLGLLLLGQPGHAQLEATAVEATAVEVTAVETLTVDLWPDYDRTAVLVLITGTLPQATLLPASITIPLPSGATLNAVARITSDNVMTDDVQFTEGEESVTFVTPDSRFRVEYYMPYTAVGSQREFEFAWLADMNVNEMDVAVQQPAVATNMNTQPIASSIGPSSADGLTYHVLPVTAVPAGQPYTVQVDYTMSDPTLTVQQVDTAETSSVEPTAVTSDMNWPLLLAVVGGILILVAVVWQVVSSRQQSKRLSKTAPPRKTMPPDAIMSAKQAVQFCHECGSPVQPEDKFCRECGTAKKVRT